MSTCRPNFYKYPGQFQPCPAYIYLYKSGKIKTGYCGEMNATPADVFNGLTLAWEIDAALMENEIDDLLEKIQPDIDVILANSEIKYTSNGNLTRIKNEEARRASERIESICYGNMTTEWEHCEDDNCRYCNQDVC